MSYATFLRKRGADVILRLQLFRAGAKVGLVGRWCRFGVSKVTVEEVQGRARGGEAQCPMHNCDFDPERYDPIWSLRFSQPCQSGQLILP